MPSDEGQLAMNDDSWGCLVTLLALVAGVWWLETKYQVVPREKPAVEQPQKPTGIVSLGDDADSAHWTLDADTVHGPRNARMGWITITPMSLDSLSKGETKRFLSVDCETTGVKTIQEITYLDDGTPIPGETIEAKTIAPKFYPPNTMMSLAVNELCKPGYGG